MCKKYISMDISYLIYLTNPAPLLHRDITTNEKKSSNTWNIHLLSPFTVYLYNQAYKNNCCTKYGIKTVSVWKYIKHGGMSMSLQ